MRVTLVEPICSSLDCYCIQCRNVNLRFGHGHETSCALHLWA